MEFELALRARDALALRPFRAGDEAALARNANHREVWRNLLGSFPHPYALEDARRWIELCAREVEPFVRLAIERRGEVIGGVDATPKDDVYDHCAHFGYWVGPEHWGDGIASLAARAMADYAFETQPSLERLEADVFAWNEASARVLTKNGFLLEGRRERRIHKDGEFVDELHYVRLRESRATSSVESGMPA